MDWEIRSVKVFFSICACMAQMGAYIAGPILVAPWLPGDGLSDTLALHSAAGFLYPCLVHTGHGGYPCTFGSWGIQSNFFFPYRSSISSVPRLFLELCVFA